MSANEIAALIVAITGAAGAIFAGIRNLRGDKTKAEIDKAAALLGGYGDMVKTLNARIAQLEEERRKDREEAAAERAAIREEHRKEIAALRAEHSRELAERDERIDELGAQVYALQNRPRNTRERKTDK